MHCAEERPPGRLAADPRPDAYERLVDRLLAPSVRYLLRQIMPTLLITLFIAALILSGNRRPVDLGSAWT